MVAGAQRPTNHRDVKRTMRQTRDESSLPCDRQHLYNICKAMEEILQQKSDQKKFTAALGYFLLKINVESSVSSMFSAFLLQLSLSLSHWFTCVAICVYSSMTPRPQALTLKTSTICPWFSHAALFLSNTTTVTPKDPSVFGTLLCASSPRSTCLVSAGV